MANLRGHARHPDATTNHVLHSLFLRQAATPVSLALHAPNSSRRLTTTLHSEKPCTGAVAWAVRGSLASMPCEWVAANLSRCNKTAKEFEHDRRFAHVPCANRALVCYDKEPCRRRFGRRIKSWPTGRGPGAACAEASRHVPRRGPHSNAHCVASQLVRREAGQGIRQQNGSMAGLCGGVAQRGLGPKFKHGERPCVQAYDATNRTVYYAWQSSIASVRGRAFVQVSRLCTAGSSSGLCCCTQERQCGPRPGEKAAAG